MISDASPDVVKGLLNEYPKAAGMKDHNKKFPSILHVRGASPVTFYD
jgi:hypothetical protein